MIDWSASRSKWATPDGGLDGLRWALRSCEADGERLPHNRDRLRGLLSATQPLAVAGHAEIRFLRQLAFAWLDAPDHGARDIARSAIASRVGTLRKPLDLEVAA